MKRKFKNTIIDEYILNIGGNKVNVNVAKYIGFEIRRIADKNVIIYMENGNKDNKVVVVDDFIVKEINTSKHITDEEIEKIISDYEKETYDTKVELLKDDMGEYINLKKKFNDKWMEASFYIDQVDFKQKMEKIGTVQGEKFVAPVWNIIFKCKKSDDGGVVNMTTIPKEMTKEDIEKELGYKIEIIN